jgi:glycosyltransferase involved in cell wall biosynthesis
MIHKDQVLILTPVKDAERFLERYFESIYRLTYPRELISMAFLESDSVDNTYSKLAERLPDLRSHFRSGSIWKKDFGFHISANTPRWLEHIQKERRSVLARSRNHLLSRALDDQDWVLWLDVDVAEYPPDIIERLLASGKDIVQPHCVVEYGGRSFELNAWRDKGKYHMDDLRAEGDLVRLHAVGGTMLLVRADVHRDGLVFPPFPYGKGNPLIRGRRLQTMRETLSILLHKGRLFKALTRMTRQDIRRVGGLGYVGEIETEGLGIMAHDMGYECWGMPNLEIRHSDLRQGTSTF